MTGENESGQVFVTKAQLIEGSKAVHEVETSIGRFRVRPLREGEKAKIEALAVKGIKASGKSDRMNSLDVSMDLDIMVSNDADVTIHVLAFGLSCGGETFSINDIKQINFPPDVSKVLVGKIREVSGMVNLDAILDQFREKQGRSGLGNSNSDGGVEADGQG